MLRVIETHTKDGSVIVEKIGTPEEITAADSFWMKRFLAGQMAPEVVAARACCTKLSAKALAEDSKLTDKEIKELAGAAQLLGGPNPPDGCGG